MSEKRIEEIRVRFAGKEQIKLYDLLRDRAFKRKSKGMSSDLKAIAFSHFFKKKLIK